MANYRHSGKVQSQAEVRGNLEDEKPSQPGAIVEDETLAGLKSGGVAPKDPSGKVTEGEATDRRENA